MEHYIAHRINDHLIHIEETLDNPGFMTLILGREKALLFDTGYGSGDLRSFVGTLTDLPVELVLSHAHFDHACAAWQFKTAWISEEDSVFYEECAGREMRAAHWGMNTRYPEKEADIAKRVSFEDYVNAPFAKLRILEKGQRFDLGGIHAAVVALPGHTVGSIGLLVEEDRIFLAGDGANPTFFLFVDHSSTLMQHKKNMQMLLELPFDSFLIGHRSYLFEKDRIRMFLQAAEKAYPAFDRIRVMKRKTASRVYRSQVGPDESRDGSAYILYRLDQYPDYREAAFDGENVIIVRGEDEDSLPVIRRELEAGSRVFLFVKRHVSAEIEDMLSVYREKLRILEEVFPDNPELLAMAFHIVSDISGADPARIYL